MSKVVNLDDFRALEDLISQRLGTDKIVIAVIDDTDTVSSYISDSLKDIELVYINKTLSERRDILFAD